jgi:hypothetical protein
MKDMVLSKMGEVLDLHLREFFSTVETEYKLPKDVLWKKWKEEEKTLVKKDKKSDYQVFFSIQRNKMIKENPNITFGEISKQVSTMWKNLSAEERLYYSNLLQNENSLDNLRKDYMKMPIHELKNLCKQKESHHKFRKKEEMINVLMEWEENKQKTQLLNFNQELTKGRSKLELSAEDKEEEEEDFYFHDDNSSNGGDSRVCGEEEDDLLTSEEDDDMFGDEME